MELPEPTLDLDRLPLIGIGPMATVHVLRSSPTAEPVAVKVFAEPMDRFTRAAFDRERSALGSLSEVSSILRADTVVEGADGRPGLCMELCEQSLARLVRAHGPLSLSDAVAVGQAVAIALAAAAEVGVGHGGVTPHNVLLRADGEPVLADFGPALRRRYAGNTAFAPPWSAPETVHDHTMTMSADLYGLGAVLFLALAGRPPFVDEDACPDRLDLPAPVRGLLAGLLAPDPADRRDDADAVFSELVDLSDLAGEPAAPLPPPQDFDDLRGDTRRERLRAEADRFFADPQDPDDETDPEPAPPSPPDGPSTPAFGRAMSTAAVLAVLVAVPMIVGGQPATPIQNHPIQNHPSASGFTIAQAARPRSVDLELAPPVDRGNTVDLSWRGDPTLRYAVVVAGAAVPTKVIFVDGRNTTLRIPVDPLRQYCFLVQATDGRQAYQTAPRAIRNAVCHL